MNFNSTQRPRVRGKPFRLFTDDLPKIDFNNPYLQENRTRRGADRGFHDYGATARRHGGLQYDQFSLPEIGSTSWSVLTPEPHRPQSHARVLSPNIAQLNKKIRRRHTVKEGPSRIILDQRLQKPDNAFSENDSGLNVCHPLTGMSQHASERTADVKAAFVRTASTRSFRSKSSKSDSVDDENVTEKPKSILQKLLDESARDSARRKMVEDGFKLFTQDKCTTNVPNVTNATRIHRDRTKKGNGETAQKRNESKITQIDEDFQQTIPIATDNHSVVKQIKENKEDEKFHFNREPLAEEDLKFDTPNCNKVSSNTNVKEPSNEKPKPGILKHNAGTSRTKIKREKNLKPRLIHQDNIQELPRDGCAGGDVKVTVHADVPFNGPNALLFDREGSHKPRTKRRVNFDKYIEDKENNKDTTNGDTTEALKDRYVPVNSESEANSDKEIDDDVSFMKYRLPRIKRRDPVRRRTRIRSTDLKTIHVSSFPTHIREPARDDVSSVADKHTKFDIVTENLKDPRVDPFWKEVKAPLEKRDHVITEPTEQTTDLAEASSDDKAKLASALSPGKVGRHWRSRSFRKTDHQSSGVITPSDSVSTTTTGSIFGNNADLDSMSDVQSFLDELGMEEHLNRGLLGEDLIKAYRIWDRKRKAFPGGLRKIEAPGDPDEDLLFPKSFGAVRTYRIPTQAPRLPPPPPDSGEQFNSVFIGSF